jgi:hypothetical protein
VQAQPKPLMHTNQIIFSNDGNPGGHCDVPSFVADKFQIRISKYETDSKYQTTKRQWTPERSFVNHELATPAMLLHQKIERS